MRSSSGRKRSPSGSATKRGSDGGTFTRAKRGSGILRIGHDDGEVQREIRDVRERVRGIDRERREHGEQPLVEVLDAATAVSFLARSSQPTNSMLRATERRA